MVFHFSCSLCQLSSREFLPLSPPLTFPMLLLWCWLSSGQRISRRGLINLVTFPAQESDSKLNQVWLLRTVYVARGCRQGSQPHQELSCIYISRTGYSGCSLLSTMPMLKLLLTCPWPVTCSFQPHVQDAWASTSGAAFLKHLPADLVHDRTSNPFTLTLRVDKIFQSCVSSASTLNHVSSAPVLGGRVSCSYCTLACPSSFSSFFHSWSQLLPCSCCSLHLLQLHLSLSVLVPQISWWSCPEVPSSLLLVGKLTGRQEDSFFLSYQCFRLFSFFTIIYFWFL